MRRNLRLASVDGDLVVAKRDAFERLVAEAKRCTAARDEAYARGDVAAAERFQRDAMVTASSAWLAAGLGDED